MAQACAASSKKVAPNEIYNLAAQSHVRVSFDQPEYTADAVGTGTLRLLEAIRDYATVFARNPASIRRVHRKCSASRRRPKVKQTFRSTRSPYAVSKVAAHWYAVNYREAWGLFICNGILFNHEWNGAERGRL